MDDLVKFVKERKIKNPITQGMQNHLRALHEEMLKNARDSIPIGSYLYLVVHPNLFIKVEVLSLSINSNLLHDSLILVKFKSVDEELEMKGTIKLDRFISAMEGDPNEKKFDWKI